MLKWGCIEKGEKERVCVRVLGSLRGYESHLHCALCLRGSTKHAVNCERPWVMAGDGTIRPPVAETQPVIKMTGAGVTPGVGITCAAACLSVGLSVMGHFLEAKVTEKSLAFFVL